MTNYLLAQISLKLVGPTPPTCRLHHVTRHQWFHTASKRAKGTRLAPSAKIQRPCLNHPPWSDQPPLFSVTPQLSFHGKLSLYSVLSCSDSSSIDQQLASCTPNPSAFAIKHGGFLHRLLPQTSGSRQRSQRSSPTGASDHDYSVVGRAAPGVRGGRGVRRRGDGGRRRRHGSRAGRGRLAGGRHRRGRGRARTAAVERPQAVPAVARQHAGEHRAGEPAPPVAAAEVQRRHGGSRPRA